jgi:hypothetical protein
MRIKKAKEIHNLDFHGGLSIFPEKLLS